MSSNVFLPIDGRGGSDREKGRNKARHDFVISKLNFGCFLGAGNKSSSLSYFIYRFLMSIIKKNVLRQHIKLQDNALGLTKRGIGRLHIN